jgi:hypothetical protein
MLPAFVLASGNPSPVGTLRCDGVVYLDGETIRAETALYSGDQVRTVADWATLALSRGNRVLMDRDSSAALAYSGQGVIVGLEKGRLAWLADPKDPSHIQTDGLALSPSGSFPTLAEVAIRNDGSLTVAVHKGAVTVRNLQASPVAVAAGKIITISPRLAQKSKPIGTGAHGKMTLGEKFRTFQIGNLSHAASLAIVGGILGAAAATSIVVPLTVGEETSPFIP